MKQSIIDRLQEKEARQIEYIAGAGAAALAATEQSTNETTLLKERAGLLCGIMQNCYDRGLNGGFITRRRERERYSKINYYLDHYDEDFIAPVENWITHLVRNGKPLFRESGLRTIPFGVTKDFSEELCFNSGWQIDVPRKRSVQRKGAEIVADPELSRNMPLRIWRHVKELSSGEEERQLAYDVSIRTGEVWSYTDAVQDDSYANLAKQAGSHALALINQAVDLFEK